MSNIFSPRSDEEWLSILNRVYLWAGGFAAIFGVIALLATKGIQIYSERVSAAQRGEVAKFGQQAALAVSETAKANERTAKLEVESEQSRTEQKRLQVQIEQSKSENLRLQSDLEKERIERLNLQARTASRRLTQDQKNKLKTALLGTPASTIKVTVFLGTDDGMPFSFDLIEAINAGGWKAEHTGQTTLGGQIRGLAILVKDNTHFPVAALYLQQALKQIGLEAPAYSDPTMMDGVVVLFIAPKIQ